MILRLSTGKTLRVTKAWWKKFLEDLLAREDWTAVLLKQS